MNVQRSLVNKQNKQPPNKEEVMDLRTGSQLENADLDLRGYKPEEVKENTNEPFKYKGPVNVLFARVEESEKASEFYGTEVGSKIFSVCLEVPEGAAENAKRRLYKKWQIESTVADGKKKKTPAMKLADWLWGAGLTFSNIEGLHNVAERMAGESWEAQCWAIKIGQDKIQMSKLAKPGTFGSQGEAKPAGQKVSF